MSARAGSGRLAALPLLALGLALAAPSGAAAEVGLLIESGLPGTAPRRLAAPEGVRVYSYASALRGDPIQEGRLLAGLEGTDRIIVVGPQAARWAAQRLDKALVHFAGGAASVPSADLVGRGWTGSVGFGVEQILDFARKADWRRVGVAYTPAFAALLPALRAAARPRGVSLSERLVSAPPQLPETVRERMGSCDAFWAFGGTTLTNPGRFDYIIEASLSGRIPVIAPEAALVEGGAYLAVAPDWDSIIAEAVALAAGAALGEPAWPQARLTLSRAPGTLVVNHVLRRKWGPAPKGGGG